MESPTMTGYAGLEQDMVMYRKAHHAAMAPSFGPHETGYKIKDNTHTLSGFPTRSCQMLCIKPIVYFFASIPPYLFSSTEKPIKYQTCTTKVAFIDYHSNRPK